MLVIVLTAAFIVYKQKFINRRFSQVYTDPSVQAGARSHPSALGSNGTNYVENGVNKSMSTNTNNKEIEVSDSVYSQRWTEQELDPNYRYVVSSQHLQREYRQ